MGGKNATADRSCHHILKLCNENQHCSILKENISLEQTTYMIMILVAL